MKTNLPTLLSAITVGLVVAVTSNIARGDIIYASDGFGTIKKIDSNGVVSAFANTGQSFGPVLAVDNSGNLYAGYYNNKTIVKFSPNGSSSVFANTSPYIPEGLAFDAAGNLYVSLYNFPN